MLCKKLLNDNIVEIATVRKVTKPKMFKSKTLVKKSWSTGRAICREEFYRLEMELIIFGSD